MEFDVLYASEPDYLDGVVLLVGELGREPPVSSRADGLDVIDPAYDLHVGVLVLKVAEVVESVSVHVSEGEDIEHVESRLYVQLFLEQGGSFGSDARAVGYIFVAELQGYFSA